MRKALLQLAALGMAAALVQPGEAWAGRHSREAKCVVNVDRSGRVAACVTVHRVYDWRDRECERPCFIGDGLWMGMQAGGRVYVDGSFCGRGLVALVRVDEGTHRVCVVTRRGQKLSAWVTFPASESAGFCYEAPRGCR